MHPSIPLATAAVGHRQQTLGKFLRLKAIDAIPTEHDQEGTCPRLALEEPGLP